MRLILLRHYKTQSNAAGRILGWRDSPPNAGWKDNIDYVCSRLRKQQISFDAVYSSDLRRSFKTAKTYAHEFGLKKVTQNAGLNEINYGAFQTKRKKWVHKHCPEHKKNPDFLYPEGESFRQMQLRNLNCIHSLESRHSNDTVLIVSHAGSIRGIVCGVLSLKYAPNLDYRVPFRYIGDFLFKHGNCVRYNELGESSGLVEKNIIKIPFKRSGTED